MFATLHNIKFNNTSLKCLPVDSSRVYQSRRVQHASFALTVPTPVSNPRLVAYSKSVIHNMLGINHEKVKIEDLVNYLSGNKLMQFSEPASHVYCGYQFGFFSGQLGDGAVIYLGEVVNRLEEKWELQLKGAGLTPFSRNADGRKVLRSSIREFLCGEYMFHVGIPTTRAATIVTSDDTVMRDIFYNGNPKSENCAIVARVAKTFIRFGSFEIFLSRDIRTGQEGPSCRSHPFHKYALINYVICRHFRHIIENHIFMLEEETKEILGINNGSYIPISWDKLKEQEEKHVCLPKKIYDAWFQDIVKLTSKLVAKWQCFGFCHGVLNTDNMSIIGDTLDYGPFGFMEYFNPFYISNTSDESGRYNYQDQPNIVKWNILKLRNAVKVVLDKTNNENLEQMFDNFFAEEYMKLMRSKLGILIGTEDDDELVKSLLTVMDDTGADFTTTFRSLDIINDADITSDESNIFYEKAIDKILKHTATNERILKSTLPNPSLENIQQKLNVVTSIPDHLIEWFVGSRLTVNMWTRQLSRIQRLAKNLQDTTNRKERDSFIWKQWMTSYHQTLCRDMHQSGYRDVSTYMSRRRCIMNQINPSVVPRNHLLQKAIEAAENGDYNEINRLLDVFSRPYDSHHMPEDCYPIINVEVPKVS